jgi:hypothetical protein
MPGLNQELSSGYTLSTQNKSPKADPAVTRLIRPTQPATTSTLTNARHSSIKPQNKPVFEKKAVVKLC